MKHTSTPWASGHEISSRAKQIFDRNGYQIGIADTTENSHFIVKAVNNHAALVSCLLNVKLLNAQGNKEGIDVIVTAMLATAKGDA